MKTTLSFKVRIVIACGAAMLLVSCTHFTPPLVSFARFSSPVNKSFGVDTNSAVVYGRFATGPDFAFGNELVLRLCDESSEKIYLIRCREKDSVYAVAVEPGRYRIAGFLATFMDHRPAGERGVPNTSFFQVRPNSATYLGDFAGYARISGMMQQWGVKEITNNFTATTETYRQKYPKLASVRVYSAFDEQ